MGKHALARAFYDDALAMMTEDATDEARDEREGRRRRAEVMANQSACALAVEAWDDAMERAERAIACDEGYAKAHARRAAALRGKREYARARESLKVCRALLAREGETKMIRDVDAMVAEIDADEARGEQAARVGMQVKMGSKAQAKPNFSAATTKGEEGGDFRSKARHRLRRGCVRFASVSTAESAFVVEAHADGSRRVGGGKGDRDATRRRRS